MTSTDSNRVRLHAGLLEEFSNSDTANLLMQNLPSIPQDQVATKDDFRGLSNELRTEMADLRTELKTEMADLRTDMADLRGDLKSEMAQNLRLIVASQLATMLMLGGWVAAVT